MSAVPDERTGSGRLVAEAENAAWIAQARAGDPQAFERIYRMHVGRIHGLCLRMVSDPTRAETLTQDVFVRAWQRLASFRGQGSFGGWLHRLAVRVVIDDRRAAARTARWFVADSANESFTGAAAQPSGSEASVAPIDMAIDLERAVSRLPAGARLVFLLHDMEGYRHHEIAAMAGVAVGTVKAQLHRARRHLRRALGESIGGAAG